MDLCLLMFCLLGYSVNAMTDDEYKTEVRTLLQRFLYELHSLRQNMPSTTEKPLPGAKYMFDRLAHDIIPSSDNALIKPSGLQTAIRLNDESAPPIPTTAAPPPPPPPPPTTPKPAAASAAKINEDNNSKIQNLLDEGKVLEKNMFNIFDKLEKAVEKTATTARPRAKVTCAVARQECGVGKRRCCAEHICSSQWQGRCVKCVKYAESCADNLFCCDSGVSCKNTGGSNWHCL